MSVDRRAVAALLPVLVTVAEVGQVTTAAAVLGLPQPTVSRALARLGTLLGTPVVERQGRGIALTAAGRALLPHARDAVAALDRGVDVVTRSTLVGHGTVALTFQTLLGEVVVPALIRRFRDQWPGVGFDLSQGARAKCLDELEAGRATVALVASPPDQPGVSTTVLYDEPLVVAVHRTHPAAATASVTVDALAGDDVIVLKTGFGLRGRVEEIWADAGADLRVGFEAEDVHTARGLVAAGLGVAVLPAFAPEGDVVPVGLDHPQAQRTIGAMVRNPAHDPTVTAFEEFVARSGRSVALAALNRRS
ncbi:LysR family transcriptional regulator [Intrasporangium flavum]|uniref:LysR family transcriptional regulator n=1 Tax=Intrasporangium flavum TaxID=1428657 RepID=UPI00096C1347|nr:LysR family transcriptional regulator [Intrasporangium flavum]